jgi:hypothetical protein
MNAIHCNNCDALTVEEKAEAASVRLISLLDAETLARRFHDMYEKKAPHYGCETRRESRTDWENVPINNKKLMIDVCYQLLKEGIYHCQ